MGYYLKETKTKIMIFFLLHKKKWKGLNIVIYYVIILLLYYVIIIIMLYILILFQIRLLSIHK